MAPLVALILLCFFFQSVKTTQGGLVPALYIFGDSTVDAGNNQYFTYPYGIDLVNDSAVRRRITNGRTIADFIATFLGLPLVVPYINASVAAASVTGVNYAFAGCGILQETAPNNWTLGNQISMFDDTISKNLVTEFNSVELKEHLERSIFLVSIGINDYCNNYLPPHNIGRLSKKEPEAFAQYLLSEMSISLTILYQRGARKFLINNIWPLGCTPDRVLQSNACNDMVNKMVLPFSLGLPVMLKKLQSNLRGTIFSHSDNFHFFKDLTENPTTYGLTNTTSACYNSSHEVCLNRDNYLYFDDIHTTEVVNRAFAVNCFNQELCQPHIIDLVRYN